MFFQVKLKKGDLIVRPKRHLEWPSIWEQFSPYVTYSVSHIEQLGDTFRFGFAHYDEPFVWIPVEWFEVVEDNR